MSRLADRMTWEPGQILVSVTEVQQETVRRLNRREEANTSSMAIAARVKQCRLLCVDVVDAAIRKLTERA